MKTFEDQYNSLILKKNWCLMYLGTKIVLIIEYNCTNKENSNMFLVNKFLSKEFFNLRLKNEK